MSLKWSALTVMRPRRSVGLKITTVPVAATCAGPTSKLASSRVIEVQAIQIDRQRHRAAGAVERQMRVIELGDVAFVGNRQAAEAGFDPRGMLAEPGGSVLILQGQHIAVAQPGGLRQGDVVELPALVATARGRVGAGGEGGDGAAGRELDGDVVAAADHVRRHAGPGAQGFGQRGGAGRRGGEQAEQQQQGALDHAGGSGPAKGLPIGVLRKRASRREVGADLQPPATARRRDRRSGRRRRDSPAPSIGRARRWTARHAAAA